MPIVAVTCASVLTNLPQSDHNLLVNNSTHEEADLKMVASPIVPKSLNVHIYSSDIDVVVVLFLSYMPLRTSEMVQILETGENKQHLKLQCILDEECMPYLGVTPQDIFRQRARKHGAMFL